MPKEFDVPLKQRSYTKPTSAYKCACDITLRASDEHNASEHEESCARALCWIVRVPYEAESGARLHGDSVRMSRADAVTLAAQYRAQKAKVVRVIPLHQPRAKRGKAAQHAEA